MVKRHFKKYTKKFQKLKFTRSILSPLNLELPSYSLYSDHIEANSPTSRHSFPSTSFHNIKIRDIPVNNYDNQNNNSNDRNISGSGYTYTNNSTATDGYIYKAKVVNENVTSGYNCTNRNSNRTISDSFNISSNNSNSANSSGINADKQGENGAGDEQSNTREVLEISTNPNNNPDIKPIKFVENKTNCNHEVHSNNGDYDEKRNDKNAVTLAKQVHNSTDIFNYVELVKLLRNETAANISYLLNITTSSEPTTSRHDDSNNTSTTFATTVTTVAKPVAKLEAETENSIEIIKSISTEYKGLIDNKGYGFGTGNDYASSGLLDNKYGKNVIYHKEDSSPTVSRIIDLTKKTKKVQDEYHSRGTSRQSSLQSGYPRGKNQNQNLVNKSSGHKGLTTDRYPSTVKSSRKSSNFKNTNSGYTVSASKTRSINLPSSSTTLDQTVNVVEKNERFRNTNYPYEISGEKFRARDESRITGVSDINALWSWNTPLAQNLSPEGATIDFTSVDSNQFSFNKLRNP